MLELVSNPFAATLGTMMPRVWTISLDFSVCPAVLSVEGDGYLIQDEGERQIVSWNNCGQWESFLVAHAEKAYLTAMGGHVCPVYARSTANTIRISNVASRLMRPHETLNVDAFVLLQNLAGIPYPQNNIFKDIQLLEASGEYLLSALGIERRRSVLEDAAVLTLDDVLDMAISRWDAHLSSGVDIAVLLSGGYDSRLNLAIACSAAGRYGNRVHAFHEHKNAHEESIATAVASAAGVPLTVHNRNAFIAEDRAVVIDPSFVDFQSGFYRDNLIRWHSYLKNIRTELPDSLIMGLGAEAHKGKYYRQIRSVAEDAERVFGIDEIIVKAIARKLGLRHHGHGSQQLYFENLALQANAFSEVSAQVDYVHYQTYIANGYGHRCHDLQQYFGIPFPFLDNAFLAAVFALPQNEKEGFSLVTRGIERLVPTLATIPYTSANEKALGPEARKPVKELMREIIHLFGPAYYDWLPPRRKGRTKISPAEHEILDATHSNSPLTAKLVGRALDGIGNVPFLRLDYLTEACFYFRFLEQEMDVICAIEGDDA